MSDQEFKDCLEFVGNASNWADKDLAVLLARAKQVRTKDRHSLVISYHYLLYRRNIRNSVFACVTAYFI